MARTITPQQEPSPADELVAEEHVLDAFAAYLDAFEAAGGSLDAHGVPPHPTRLPLPVVGEPLRLRDALALSPLEVERIITSEHPSIGAAILAHKRSQVSWLREAWGAWRRSDASAQVARSAAPAAILTAESDPRV